MQTMDACFRWLLIKNSFWKRRPCDKTARLWQVISRARCLPTTTVGSWVCAQQRKTLSEWEEWRPEAFVDLPGCRIRLVHTLGQYSTGRLELINMSDNMFILTWAKLRHKPKQSKKKRKHDRLPVSTKHLVAHVLH